jgi:hypothetical protein
VTETVGGMARNSSGDIRVRRTEHVSEVCAVSIGRDTLRTLMFDYPR